MIGRTCTFSSPFGLLYKACTDASRFVFVCFYPRFTIYWFLLLGNSAFGNGLDGLTGVDYLYVLYIIMLARAATAGSLFDRVADLIATKSYRHYK